MRSDKPLSPQPAVDQTQHNRTGADTELTDSAPLALTSDAADNGLTRRPASDDRPIDGTENDAARSRSAQAMTKVELELWRQVLPLLLYQEKKRRLAANMKTIKCSRIIAALESKARQIDAELSRRMHEPFFGNDTMPETGATAVPSERAP